jgi:nucleotide-binding universal stress UspA family protein
MRILVATDLSQGGDAALAEALRVPGAKVAAVHVMPNLLAVTPFFPQETREHAVHAAELERRAADAMQRHLDKFANSQSVELFLEQGVDHEQVLACAKRWGADTIVTASHRHSAVAHALLGSVAERIAREATCSVLVNRMAQGKEKGPVVVACDLSAASVDVLRAAAHQAKQRGVGLQLVHVVDHAGADFASSAIAQLLGAIPPINDELVERAKAQAHALAAERLRTADISHAEIFIKEGATAERVLHHAAEMGAQLVVVGTHGSQGLPRLLLGSVAERILRRATVSVLITRRPLGDG